MTVANFILSLFCIFEIICVPAIFLHAGLWGLLVLFLLLLAVFVFVLWKMKRLPRQGNGTEQKREGVTGKKISALGEKLRVLCILCILFQLALVVFYRHTDDDDAW